MSKNPDLQVRTGADSGPGSALAAKSGLVPAVVSWHQAGIRFMIESASGNRGIAGSLSEIGTPNLGLLADRWRPDRSMQSKASAETPHLSVAQRRCGTAHRISSGSPVAPAANGWHVPHA